MMRDTEFASINQRLETNSRELPHLMPAGFSLGDFDGNVIEGIKGC
jgi:hypothetical protein